MFFILFMILLEDLFDKDPYRFSSSADSRYKVVQSQPNSAFLQLSQNQNEQFLLFYELYHELLQ